MEVAVLGSPHQYLKKPNSNSPYGIAVFEEAAIQILGAV